MRSRHGAYRESPRLMGNGQQASQSYNPQLWSVCTVLGELGGSPNLGAFSEDNVYCNWAVDSVGIKVSN